MKRNKKILIAAAVSGILSAGMLSAAHAANADADGTKVAAADKSNCNGKNGCKGNGCKGKNGCNGKCDAHTCKGSNKCKGKKGSESKKVNEKQSQTETAPVTQEDAARAPASQDTDVHDDPS